MVNPSRRRGAQRRSWQSSRCLSGKYYGRVILCLEQVKEESSAYFFWAIYITLVLLAVGNLVTTLIVVHVLRFLSVEISFDF